MSIYGVTATGFIVKPLDTIQAEIEADLRAAFGADVNLDAREPLGQLAGIFAERFSEAWDLAEAVYRSSDPDGASGDALDAVAALTGTMRLAATRSSAPAVLAGTAATVIPGATSMVSAPSTGARFALRAAVTLSAVSAWAPTTTYAVGTRRANGGEVYQVASITTGISASSGGPAGTGTAIVDGGVTWRWVGTGAAAGDGIFDAVETGPKQALAGALSQIETPVSGWTTVVNVTDATLGTDLETDAALRVRREQGLRAVGSAALDAIRADVLAVSGVTACTVFENASSSTDGSGVPAKAIEVLVSGGVDQAIRDAIWGSKAAGIETHGSTSGTTLDSQGVAHTVEFSRPSELLVYLDLTIVVDAATLPVDGDTQIAAALAAKQFAAGESVVSWQLKKLISVSGVTDVTLLKIGLSAWPTTETTLVATSRQLARLDSSRVRITHV